MEIHFNPGRNLFEVHGSCGIEYEDVDVQKCITYRMTVEAKS